MYEDMYVLMYVCHFLTRTSKLTNLSIRWLWKKNVFKLYSTDIGWPFFYRM